MGHIRTQSSIFVLKTEHSSARPALRGRSLSWSMCGVHILSHALPIPGLSLAPQVIFHVTSKLRPPLQMLRPLCPELNLPFPTFGTHSNLICNFRSENGPFQCTPLSPWAELNLVHVCSLLLVPCPTHPKLVPISTGRFSYNT